MTDFDPATDPAKGMNKARVKDAYEKALQRGNDDLAGEIRAAETLSEADRLRKNMRAFDPLHDAPTNSAKARLAKIYETLLELGHHEKAEDLRLTDDLGAQERRADEILAEIPAEVDRVTGEIKSRPEPDAADAEEV